MTKSEASSKKPQVLAIVPIRERDAFTEDGPMLLAGRPVLAHTIEAALASRKLTRTIVSTDGAKVATLAKEHGVEAPFLRPPALSASEVSLLQVLQYTLRTLEEQEEYVPEYVVLLEASHPLRPSGLIDSVVEALLEQGLQTVFTAFESRHAYWRIGRQGDLQRLDNSEGATRVSRAPLYGQITGLACATRADVIRAGALIGDDVGIVPVRGLTGLVDLQDEGGLELAEFLLARGYQ